MNGRREVLSYGRTAIVWVFTLSPLQPLIVSDFVAGSGKSILWYATHLADFVDVVYIGG